MSTEAHSHDVIVLGLGGMGSAAAAALAARGLRVLGIDRFGPAHAQGSSHGGSRIYRQAYYEDPFYVPLLRRALELWQQLETEVPGTNLNMTGGLLIGRPDSRIVAGSVRSAQQWHLDYRVLTPSDVATDFPTFRLGDDEVAVYECAAGFVRPEMTVSAQLRLAQRHGATLRYGTTARSWHANSSGHGVSVVTDAGTEQADALVLTPGAWAPSLLPEWRLVVERQVMHWFAPDDNPSLYDPQRHPVFIGTNETGREFYGFPLCDGAAGGVKVAFFRQRDPCTADTINRRIGPSEPREIANFIRRWLPHLPGAFLRAATCLYTTTPDSHFVVGQHPGHAQVAIACGFSGHGFKFAPVIGEILADLVCDGHSRHAIYPLFDPERAAVLR